MRRARRGATIGQVESTGPIERRRVVIAGGGVAALEAVAPVDALPYRPPSTA